MSTKQLYLNGSAFYPSVEGSASEGYSRKITNLNLFSDLSLCGDGSVNNLPYGAVSGTSSIEKIEFNGETWIKVTKIGGSYAFQSNRTQITRTIEEGEILRVKIKFYNPNGTDYKITDKSNNASYTISKNSLTEIDYQLATTVNDSGFLATGQVVANDTNFPVGGYFYVSAPILYSSNSAIQSDVIDSEFDGYKTNKWYGKKFVFGGDSITVTKPVNNGVTYSYGAYITPLKNTFKPLLFGREVSTSNVGGDGNRRTALGGSTLLPIIWGGSSGDSSSDTAYGTAVGKGPGESLYERSKDFYKYSPNVILLYIGANDQGYLAPFDTYEEVESKLLEYKQNNPTWDPNGSNPSWTYQGSIPLGSKFDEPYSGGEVDCTDRSEYGSALFKIEGNAINWRCSTNLTFASSYKAMILRLQNEMPDVPIYLCTNVPNYAQHKDSIPDNLYSMQLATRNKVIEIGEVMGCGVIDLWSQAGINRYNYRRTGVVLPYLGDGIHPTTLGGDMIARCIANYLGL